LRNVEIKELESTGLYLLSDLSNGVTGEAQKAEQP